MRLIDADELENEFGISDADIIAKEVIRDAPTVDAVPVVRCEYCNKGHYELGMNGCVWCVRYSRDMNTDDFCSYWERKKGAEP